MGKWWLVLLLVVGCGEPPPVCVETFDEVIRVQVREHLESVGWGEYVKCCIEHFEEGTPPSGANVGCFGAERIPRSRWVLTHAECHLVQS